MRPARLALLASLALSAAAPAAPIQALVEDVDYGWTFFLRPEVKLTEIKGRSAQCAGGLLGAALSRTLYLGAGAYGLVNTVRDGGVKLGAFDFWYTGAHADYTLFTAKLLHGSLSGFLGGGQVRDGGAPGGSDSATLFVAEPSLNLEFNLTSCLELGAGAGYRFVNGADLDRLSDGELSGWTATLFLRWTEP